MDDAVGRRAAAALPVQSEGEDLETEDLDLTDLVNVVNDAAVAAPTHRCEESARRAGLGQRGLFACINSSAIYHQCLVHTPARRHSDHRDHLPPHCPNAVLNCR